MSWLYKLKGLGFEGPLKRQKWRWRRGRRLSVNTQLSATGPDLSTGTAGSSNERMCASIRILFVTIVQFFETPFQRERKIGLQKFWEARARAQEELADSDERHAMLPALW